MGAEDHELIVIGGGAAGLAAARTGARRGAATSLISAGPIGGDCTFTGCVPSKTLIEHAARRASFGDAMKAVRDAVERVAATETPQALSREGIEVVTGRAVFTGPREIRLGERRLCARRFVLATGSRPTIPQIPGLADVQYLTNENIFDLPRPPHSLTVLGGGAIGCELAQAFRRFGTEVTVIEALDRLLPAEDSEASQVIERVFAREGIDVRTTTRAIGAEVGSVGIRLKTDGGDTIEAEHLLVAVGRTPSATDLGLETVGIRTDRRGAVRTNAHLGTTASGVYAAGDVTGRLQLTHAAYAMGRIAAANALGSRPRATYTDDGVPRVIFTDPEVAQVGHTESHAARLDARVAYLPMTELDRAITADRTDGFIKIIAGPRRVLGHRGGGRVLGATIVAARAGEMIHEPALAIRTGMFTGRLAQTIHAYPTWSIAIQQTAAQFFGAHGDRPARHVASGAGTGHPSAP